MAQEAIGSTPIRTTREEVREPTGLKDLNENWILPIRPGNGERLHLTPPRMVIKVYTLASPSS